MEAALPAQTTHRFGLIVSRADACLASLRERERLARHIRRSRPSGA